MSDTIHYLHTYTCRWVLVCDCGFKWKNGEDGPLTPLFKAVDNAWSDLFLTNKIIPVSIAVLNYNFRHFVYIDYVTIADLLSGKTLYF